MSISRELNIGRAGEYLVLADLLLKGYQTFDGGQGVDYDVVLEDKNRKLIKIQVKTTTKPVKHGNSTQFVYFFNIKRNGKHGMRRYSDSDFDIYALVMLDIRQIAYLVNKNINNTLILRNKNLKYRNEINARYFQDLTLEKALKELEV